MKSLILLAVLATFFVVQVHGCSIPELAKCMNTATSCDGLLKSMNCYKACGVDLPDSVTKAIKDAGCGASALTNLGLPMMLLVAVVTIYNKQ